MRQRVHEGYKLLCSPKAMVSFSNPPSSSSKKLYGKASQALASELVSQTRPLPIQALKSIGF